MAIICTVMTPPLVYIRYLNTETVHCDVLHLGKKKKSATGERDARVCIATSCHHLVHGAEPAVLTIYCAVFTGFFFLFCLFFCFVCFVFLVVFCLFLYTVPSLTPVT